MQSQHHSTEPGSHAKLRGRAARPLLLRLGPLLMLAGCSGTVRSSETLGAAGANGSNVASSSAGATGASGAAGSGEIGGGSGGLDSFPTSAGAESGGSAATGTSEAGAAAMLGTPTVGDDGYVRISAGANTLVGYVGSYVGGSGSSITLTYASTSFCASGTVGINSSYQSYAGAGFNVNQAQSPTDGDVESLLLTGKSIELSYTNSAGSPLRLQVTNSSITSWCYDLDQATSPVIIPLSSLNTHCWDGTGDAFVPGTPITAIQLLVPGNTASATPFNFCLEGLVIQ